MLKKSIYILLGFCLSFSCNAAVNNNFSWVELGDKGIPIARMITTDKQCPTIVIDGKKQDMPIRAVPSKEFPVMVCEFPIPLSAKRVSINDQALVLPKRHIKRIAIIGDTGCRLQFFKQQACNDPNQWPFAKLIQQIEQANPDLVIHVGDYIYRETPCLFSKGCAGSAYGDNWQSWLEDFFIPTKRLLQKSPWIFARGNHENCNRAGEAWFKFLDPAKYSSTCHKHSASYQVPFQNIQFFVIDSSTADDTSIKPEQVHYFEQDFAKLARVKEPVWLISHKPLWTESILNLKDIDKNNAYLTSLQQAAKNSFNENVQLILSGHIHLFQTLNFKGRPTQIIVGNSGAELEKFDAKPDLAGLRLTNAVVESGINIAQFGYLLLEQTDDGWIGQVKDINSNVLATCRLKQQQFICKNQVK